MFFVRMVMVIGGGLVRRRNALVEMHVCSISKLRNSPCGALNLICFKMWVNVVFGICEYVCNLY